MDFYGNGSGGLVRAAPARKCSYFCTKDLIQAHQNEAAKEPERPTKVAIPLEGKGEAPPTTSNPSRICSTQGTVCTNRGTVSSSQGLRRRRAAHGTDFPGAGRGVSRAATEGCRTDAAAPGGTRRESNGQIGKQRGEAPFTKERKRGRSPVPADFIFYI